MDRSFARTALVVSFVVLALAPQIRGEEGMDEAQKAIFQYVQRAEPDYAWKYVRSQQFSKGVLHEVQLTSQKWQGLVWKHSLLICEPTKVEYPNHVLLFVSGGRNGRPPGTGDLQQSIALANLCGARVAMLLQVPNQPLLGDRVEDDLITETWLRYLKTGDANWPLLFPMVKSAVKAMDAVEAFVREKFDTEVKGFVISGASKRGWTSWLTPVVDQRVMATAPVVIDVLNFRPQMKHQLATWGEYSPQIIDYTSKGLIVEGQESKLERRLRLMMDPFTYRSDLTLPKLLVNGTNDPYWVCDAMKWYWNDLAGPKYILQVPNAGHGLEGGRQLAFSTLAAFFRHNASATPLPEITWTHKKAPEGVAVEMRSSVEPMRARLWVAYSDSKDFRKSDWKSQPLSTGDANNGRHVFLGTAANQTGRNAAHFGELQFRIGNVLYSLCTLIHRHE